MAAAAAQLKRTRDAAAQAAAALEARGISPGVAVAEARAVDAAARAAMAVEGARLAEVGEVLLMEQRLAKLRALHERLLSAWRPADDAAGGHVPEVEAGRDVRATQEAALARLAQIKRRRAALDEEEEAAVRECLRAGGHDQTILARAEELRREAFRALA